MHSPAAATPPVADSARAIFWVFLRLGCTSFGGPVAHLGYFRDEFAARRRWLDEASYADLVALCQFLPGPSSSQVGMGIGLIRGGIPGMFAAWAGFTLPSALLLLLFAFSVLTLDATTLATGALHGLKVAAVAVVAQAILGMAQSLCPDRVRASVAVVAAAIVLLGGGAMTQIVAILLGGLFGWYFLHAEVHAAGPLALTLSRRAAVGCLGLFVGLLLGLPLVAGAVDAWPLALFDAFYRSGALVFGGGHVVLPLLQESVVQPGWVSNDLFLAGYGAAQAVPGPLFTFSAYLGTVTGGVVGALICLLAIFMPSFLLILGVLPFWDWLRERQPVRNALSGVNAAVVGLLAAAFYTPVWQAGILSAGDYALALSAWLLLALWRLPPWLVVILSGFGGALIG